MHLTSENTICHVSARLKAQDAALMNGEASDSKKKLNTVEEVLRGLVDWICAQVRRLPCTINYFKFDFLSFTLYKYCSLFI